MIYYRFFLYGTTMIAEKLLFTALVEGSPFIHENRINAVLDVSIALRDSQNLSLSQICVFR
jgi:hypothetical protein